MTISRGNHLFWALFLPLFGVHKYTNYVVYFSPPQRGKGDVHNTPKGKEKRYKRYVHRVPIPRDTYLCTLIWALFRHELVAHARARVYRIGTPPKGHGGPIYPPNRRQRRQRKGQKTPEKGISTPEKARKKA